MLCTNRWSFLFLALALAAIAPRFAAAEEDKVLYIYTWQGYFDPEVIRGFERKNQCRVEFDYYDSNETMFQALTTGGGGYDIITPDAVASATLYEKRMVRLLDHGLLPNLKYLDPNSTALSEDPNMSFSVPYTVTGVGYNRKLVPADAIGSWDIFSDARFGKRLAMLNDTREVIGAGLKRLGRSLNSVNPNEVRAAGELIRDWKKNLALFDVDQAKEDLRNGKLAAIQAYNGDIAELMAENEDIGFFVPREGTAFNSDSFVISIDSPSIPLAHAFINHLLDPEVAVKNMEGIRYNMPNIEALKRCDPRLRESVAINLPSDIRAKCEPIRNLGTARAIYDEVWDEILLGN